MIRVFREEPAGAELQWGEKLPRLDKTEVASVVTY